MELLDIGQILLYIMALGIPTAWLTRWLYQTWRKANMPAIWAWMLQQRRRDRTIKALRLRVGDLEQRLNTLEGDGAAERLENVLARIGNCERMIARLRDRLRQRGINIDG